MSLSGIFWVVVAAVVFGLLAHFLGIEAVIIGYIAWDITK